VYISLAPLLGIAATTLILLTTLANLSRLRPPNRSASAATTLPSLDVLIPARNEAHTIDRCVESILGQHYPELTITILDDGSTDDTPQILADIAYRNPQVRIISGEPLPAGWTGKNWACHQLSLTSQAHLMLFTDADTWFAKGGIRRWVEAHMITQSDLTTLVPDRRSNSPAISLVIGFINWFVLGLLPLQIAYKTSIPVLSMTFGQFMLFSAAAYDHIGGYASIKESVTDDVSLGRRIKSHKLRWRLFDGTKDVVCEMYSNNRDLIYGVGRSILPVLGYKTLYLIIGIIAFLVFAWTPVITLILHISINSTENFYPYLSALMVFFLGITWYISQRQFRQPKWVAFAYPLAISFVILISIHAAITLYLKRSSWKGRIISKPEKPT